MFQQHKWSEPHGNFLLFKREVRFTWFSSSEAKESSSGSPLALHHGIMAGAELEEITQGCFITEVGMIEDMISTISQFYSLSPSILITHSTMSQTYVS